MGIIYFHDLRLDTKINYGKHKGKFVKDIIEIDRGWICWAMENIEGFNLDEFSFKYLIQMETLTNDKLLQLEIPARCSKKDIKVLALNIIENSIEDGRILKTAEGLAVMEKLVKAVREEADFVNAVVDELERNRGQIITPNGTVIECMEAGVKYDFSYDQEWRSIDEQIKNLTEQKKSREAILKATKSGAEGVDESTGEIIIGANKSSKTTYKVTLSK